MSDVEWPGRGNKGKGSIKRTETHNNSMTALIVEAGKFHEQMIGDDYSLERKERLLKGNNRSQKLLRRSNPFQMRDLKEKGTTDNPRNIGLEKDARYGEKK